MAFDPFLALSQFIANYSVFVFFAFAVISIFFVKKRTALFIALFLAFAAGPLLKDYFKEERPCWSSPAPVQCPPEYGMPSLHALTSAVFAIGSLGSPAFLLFAPAAAIISYSRIYLNVHSIEQVAASVALAITFYSFATGIVARIRNKKPFAHRAKFGKNSGEKSNASNKGMQASGELKLREWRHSHELRRQALHIAFGLAIIASGVLFGKTVAVTLLLSALSLGIFSLGLYLLGIKVPLSQEIFDSFERKGVLPGKGAMHYAAGCLLLLTLSPFDFALAMVAVLALGDGASTIVGRLYGKKKLPWNQAKSGVGTCAFFAFGAASAALFIPLEQAAGYSFLLALIETIPTEVDDNLLIPIAALVLQNIQKVLGI